MICRIERQIFHRFPSFCRGIVFASGVDNSRPSPEMLDLLRGEEERRREELAAETEHHPRIRAWLDVYRELGEDPRRHTPSVAFLLQRLRSGKALASVSPVVDLFNFISLRYLVPAGGDSLDGLGGHLSLGLATGEETFSPIFRPERVEHPQPDEVVYVHRPSNRVLCRRWNWRNADFSKITPQTRTLLVNVDGLTSVIAREEIEEATQALAQLLLRTCQGIVSSHILDADHHLVEVLNDGL